MIRSVAIIYLFLIIHSQMARLSNRRKHHPQSEGMHRALEHPRHPLHVPKITRPTTHSQRLQGSAGHVHGPSARPESRITLRLTHRNYEPFQVEGQREVITPALPANTPEDAGHLDRMVVDRDREDWLRVLRPRPGRELAPVRRKTGKPGTLHWMHSSAPRSLVELEISLWPWFEKHIEQ